jgi:calpain family cysteine protease/putative extracellular protein
MCALGVNVKNSRNTRRRLQYEPLEKREMMALTATLTGGVLTIDGTRNANTVNFRQNDGTITVAGVKGSWSADQVNSIFIDLGKGNDVISFNSIANGGNQSLAESITVNSSKGVDLVHLADGHDVSLNGLGHTLSVAVDGSAALDGQPQSWDNSTPPSPSAPSTPNWFDSNVIDAALRSLGHNLYADGKIDRNDMIALLKNVEDGGIIDTTEFADLKKIVTNSTLFGTFDYVWKLSSYVVSGNTANAKYQGGTLGNLKAGSATAQMEKLINKWFLGLDRPTAGGTYRQASGQLFVNGATYADVKQGYLGDCYFMASLGEAALKNPAAITNMFVVNGDGTYTVRFFNAGKAEYVTVDSYLPTNGAGQLIYAGLGKMYNNASNELWTALAEKAHVQINEMGWQRVGLPGNGVNAYSAIEGGYIYAAMGHITGQATSPFTATAGTTSFTTFVNAFDQGKMIGFASKSTPASSQVVGGHAYAVVGYNATNKTVTLFNPWGVEYGLVTMTWSQIQANFSYFDRTV